MFVLSVRAYVVCMVVACYGVLSHPGYRDKIPNGSSVPHPCPNYPQRWDMVGHQGPNRQADRLRRNPFGIDFRNNGHVWTMSLCQKDSDGDGLTNGQELGDPNCRWREGQTAENPATGHPGYCDMTGTGRSQCGSSYYECPWRQPTVEVSGGGTTGRASQTDISIPPGRQPHVGFPPGTGRQSRVGFPPGTDRQTRLGFTPGTGSQTGTGFPAGRGSRTVVGFPSGMGRETGFPPRTDRRTGFSGGPIPFAPPASQSPDTSRTRTFQGDTRTFRGPFTSRSFGAQDRGFRRPVDLGFQGGQSSTTDFSRRQGGPRLGTSSSVRGGAGGGGGRFREFSSGPFFSERPVFSGIRDPRFSSFSPQPFRPPMSPFFDFFGTRGRGFSSDPFFFF